MEETGKDQYVEQKITQQVTVASGATGTVSVTVPSDGKAFLKGYGYTWFTSNVFKLRVGSRELPSRTDQEGSTSIPVIYGNPFPANSGEQFELSITNGDSASHTYDVVMYVVTNRIIEVNSVGGELILATGGSGSAVGGVVLYDSSYTTAAGVTAKGLAVDPQSPTTLLAGTKTASTTASALASTTACKKVIIQVATGSPNVYIGNATSQPIQLVATQSIEIEIDDIAKIFVKKVTTDATLNYIAS